MNFIVLVETYDHTRKEYLTKQVTILAGDQIEFYATEGDKTIRCVYPQSRVIRISIG